MTKHFKVARHVFSLNMADDNPMWESLTNYAPFETEDSADSIFTLDFVDKMDPVEKTVIYNEKSEEEDMPRIEVYENADPKDTRGKWIFEMAPVQKMNICARVIISEDFSHGILAAADRKGIGLFAINNALMLIYAFRTAGLGTLEMHSSVIMNGGKGYMFLGKSGTGKSTHSSLWLKYIPGSVLMNDDNPILRLDSDGTARVYGSPWSGKTPCYKNIDAPVGAIVRLNQYPENKIRKCNLFEAYANIYPSCSGLRSIESIGDGLHETIGQVAENVPCYVLDCLPDEAAAVLCHDTVTR